jgi:hypothetical protein
MDNVEKHNNFMNIPLIQWNFVFMLFKELLKTNIKSKESKVRKVQLLQHMKTVVFFIP